VKLLLATDGKNILKKAVNYAFDYASLQKATLYIIFVVSPKAEEDKEKLIKLGMKMLNKLRQRGARKDIKIITMLEIGNPYETILKVSERVKADAIIVGTSSKTAFDRVLIGSVSEYIVRMLTPPLLLSSEVQGVRTLPFYSGS
jgi:nucleotide-binding universal stress UspA family protein